MWSPIFVIITAALSVILYSNITQGTITCVY